MASVSVVMPTFDQAGFLRRAVESVFEQSFGDWELVVVDDGPPGGATTEAVAPYLVDGRVRYHRGPTHAGLAAACNIGLSLAIARLIAYLPSDDVWLEEHLASLVACLDEHDDAVLAFARVRTGNQIPPTGVVASPSSDAQLSALPLQLVQVAHRRTSARWTERNELVNDDLDRSFWSELRATGRFVGTGRQTCERRPHQANDVPELLGIKQ